MTDVNMQDPFVCENQLKDRTMPCSGIRRATSLHLCQRLMRSQMRHLHRRSKDNARVQRSTMSVELIPCQLDLQYYGCACA